MGRTDAFLVGFQKQANLVKYYKSQANSSLFGKKKWLARGLIGTGAAAYAGKSFVDKHTN